MGTQLSVQPTSLVTRMILSGASPTQVCTSLVFLHGLSAKRSWKGTMPPPDRSHGETVPTTTWNPTERFPSSTGTLNSNAASNTSLDRERGRTFLNLIG